MSPSPMQRGTAQHAERPSNSTIVTELVGRQKPAYASTSGSASRCASQLTPKP